MIVETKALARFEVKGLNAETRTFEGYASTWDMDLGMDMIHKGAFAKTLRDWRSTKRVIPLIDQHDYWTVRSVLGKLIDAKETDEGLWTKYLVTEGSDGDELLHRLRGGMIDGLSIGYEIVSSDEEIDDSTYIRHLREVKLVEVSAVIWGMNPNALIDASSVKSLDAVKAHLAQIDIKQITDEDRKELRGLASRIGALLRPVQNPPAPAPAAAKAADDTGTEEEPDTPPAPPSGDEPEAPEPKADPVQPEPPEYSYSEALQQRLSALTEKA